MSESHASKFVLHKKLLSYLVVLVLIGTGAIFYLAIFEGAPGGDPTPRPEIAFNLPSGYRVTVSDHHTFDIYAVTGPSPEEGYPRAKLTVRIGSEGRLSPGAEDAPKEPGELVGRDVQWAVWSQQATEGKSKGRSYYMRQAAAEIEAPGLEGPRQIAVQAFITGTNRRQVETLYDIAQSSRIKRRSVR